MAIIYSIHWITGAAASNRKTAIESAYRLAHSVATSTTGTASPDGRLMPMIAVDDGGTDGEWYVIRVDTDKTRDDQDTAATAAALSEATASGDNEVWLLNTAAGRKYALDAHGGKDEYIIASSFSGIADNAESETPKGSETVVTINDSGENVFRFRDGVRIGAHQLSADGGTLSIGFGTNSHKALLIHDAHLAKFKLGDGDSAVELTLREFVNHVRIKTAESVADDPENTFYTVGDEITTAPLPNYDRFIAYIPGNVEDATTLLNTLYLDASRGAITGKRNLGGISDGTISTNFNSGTAFWAYLTIDTTLNLKILAPSVVANTHSEMVILAAAAASQTYDFTPSGGIDEYLITLDFTGALTTSARITIDDPGENIFRFETGISIAGVQITADGAFEISFRHRATDNTAYKALRIENVAASQFILGSDSALKLTAAQFAKIAQGTGSGILVQNSDVTPPTTGLPDIPEPIATSLFFFLSTSGENKTVFNQYNQSVIGSHTPAITNIPSSVEDYKWYLLEYNPATDTLDVTLSENTQGHGQGTSGADEVWIWDTFLNRTTTTSGAQGVDTYHIDSSFSVEAAKNDGTGKETHVTIDDSGNNIYRFRTGVIIKSAVLENGVLKVTFGSATAVGLTINNAEAGSYRFGNTNTTAFNAREFVAFIEARVSEGNTPGPYTVPDDLDDNAVPDLSTIAFMEGTTPAADKLVEVNHAGTSTNLGASGTLTAAARDPQMATLTSLTHNGDDAVYGTFTFTPNAENTGGAWTYTLNPTDRDTLRQTAHIALVAEVITFTATDSNGNPWTYDVQIDISFSGAADRDLGVSDLFSGQATTVIYGVLFTHNAGGSVGNDLRIIVSKDPLVTRNGVTVNSSNDEYTITVTADTIITPELLKELWDDDSTRSGAITATIIDPDIPDALEFQGVGIYHFRGGSASSDSTMDDKAVTLDWTASDITAGNALEASGRLTITDPDNTGGTTVAVVSGGRYGEFTIPATATANTFDWTYTLNPTDPDTRGLAESGVRASLNTNRLIFTAITPGEAGNELVVYTTPGTNNNDAGTAKIRYLTTGSGAALAVDFPTNANDYPTLDKIKKAVDDYNTANPDDATIRVTLEDPTMGDSQFTGSIRPTNLRGGVDPDPLYDIITISVTDSTTPNPGISFHDIPIKIAVTGELREIAFTIGADPSSVLHPSGATTTATASLTENTAYTGQSILANISAALSGADGGDAAITLDAASRALGFAYDAATNAITFTGTLDFEALTDANAGADGLQHRITLTATHGSASAATHNVDVTIVDVDEGPAPAVPFPARPLPVFIGNAWEYTHPAFVAPEGAEITEIEARLANGDRLPNWLDYDEASRSFTIAADGVPSDAEERYTITLTATSKAEGEDAKTAPPQAITLTLAPLFSTVPEVDLGRATGGVYDNEGKAIFEAIAATPGVRGEGITITMVEDRGITPSVGSGTGGSGTGGSGLAIAFEVVEAASGDTAIIARYNPVDYPALTVGDFITAARGDADISSLIHLGLADGVDAARPLTGMATRGFTPATDAAPVYPGDDPAFLALGAPLRAASLNLNGLIFTAKTPGVTGNDIAIQSTPSATEMDGTVSVSYSNSRAASARGLVLDLSEEAAMYPTLQTIIDAVNASAEVAPHISVRLAVEGTGDQRLGGAFDLDADGNHRFLQGGVGGPYRASLTIDGLIFEANTPGEAGNGITIAYTNEADKMGVGATYDTATRTLTLTYDFASPPNLGAIADAITGNDAANAAIIAIPTPEAGRDATFGGHLSGGSHQLIGGAGDSPLGTRATLTVGGLTFTAVEAGAAGDEIRVTIEEKTGATNDSADPTVDLRHRTITLAVPPSVTNYPDLATVIDELRISDAAELVTIGLAEGAVGTDKISLATETSLSGGVGQPTTPVAAFLDIGGLRFTAKEAGAGGNSLKVEAKVVDGVTVANNNVKFLWDAATQTLTLALPATPGTNNANNPTVNVTLRTYSDLPSADKEIFSVGLAPNTAVSTRVTAFDLTRLEGGVTPAPVGRPSVEFYGVAFTALTETHGPVGIKLARKGATADFTPSVEIVDGFYVINIRPASGGGGGEVITPQDIINAWNSGVDASDDARRGQILATYAGGEQPTPVDYDALIALDEYGTGLDLNFFLPEGVTRVSSAATHASVMLGGLLFTADEAGTAGNEIRILVEESAGGTLGIRSDHASKTFTIVIPENSPIPLSSAATVFSTIPLVTASVSEGATGNFTGEADADGVNLSGGSGASITPEVAFLDAGGLRFTAKEAGAAGNSFKVEAKVVDGMTVANGDVGFLWNAATQTLTLALPALAVNYPTLGTIIMEFKSSAPDGASDAFTIDSTKTVTLGTLADDDKITAFELTNLQGGVTPAPADRHSLEFYGLQFTPLTDDHGLIGIKFNQEGSGSSFTPSVEIEDGFYVITIRPRTGSGRNDEITPEEIINLWNSGVEAADDARRGHILITYADGAQPTPVRFRDLEDLSEYAESEALIFANAMLPSERGLIAADPRPPIGVIGTDGRDDLTHTPVTGDESRPAIIFGGEGDDTITLGAAVEEIVYRVNYGQGRDAITDEEDEVSGFTRGQDRLTFVVNPATPGQVALDDGVFIIRSKAAGAALNGVAIEVATDGDEDTGVVIAYTPHDAEGEGGTLTITTEDTNTYADILAQYAEDAAAANPAAYTEAFEFLVAEASRPALVTDRQSGDISGGAGATTLADLLSAPDADDDNDPGFTEIALIYDNRGDGSYTGIKFTPSRGNEVEITFAEALTTTALGEAFGGLTESSIGAIFEDGVPDRRGDAVLSSAFGRSLLNITSLFGGAEFIKVAGYVPAYEAPPVAVTLAYDGAGAVDAANTNLMTFGYRFVAPSVAGARITHNGGEALYGDFGFDEATGRWTYRLQSDDPDTAALGAGSFSETISFTVTDIEGARYTDTITIPISVDGTAMWLSGSETQIRDTTPNPAMAFVEIHGVRFTRLATEGAIGIEIRTGAVSGVGLTDLGMRYFIALNPGREVTPDVLKTLWESGFGGTGDSGAAAHAARIARLAAIRAEIITDIDAGATTPDAITAAALSGLDAYFPGSIPVRPSVEIEGVRFTWVSDEAIPGDFQIKFTIFAEGTTKAHGVYYNPATANAGASYEIILDEAVDDGLTPQELVLLWNRDEADTGAGGRAGRVGQIHASLERASSRGSTPEDLAESGEGSDGIHTLAIPTRSSDIPDQPVVDGSVVLNHHDSSYSILRSYGRLTITDTDGVASVTHNGDAARYGVFSFDETTGLWAYTLNPLDADTFGLAEGAASASETITFTVTDAATPANTATHMLNININVVGTSEGLFGGSDTTFTELDDTDATFPRNASAHEVIIHGVRFTYQGDETIPPGFRFRVEVDEGSQVDDDRDGWVLQINGGDRDGEGADTDFTPAELVALWNTNTEDHDEVAERMTAVKAEVISPALGGVDLSNAAEAGRLAGDYTFKQRPNHTLTIDLEDSANNVTETNGRLLITDGDGIASITHDGATATKYGTFSFDAGTGAWGYTLNTDHPEIASLNQRARIIETITFTATDGGGRETTHAFEIGIEAVAAGAPIAPSHFPTTLTATEHTDTRPSATGPEEKFIIPEFTHIDGATLTYTLSTAGTEPNWITFGASGTGADARTITVTPLADDAYVGLENAITINVKVDNLASNGDVISTTTETTKLVIANVNDLPKSLAPTELTELTVTEGGDPITMTVDYFSFMDNDKGDVLHEVINFLPPDKIRLVLDGEVVQVRDRIPVADIASGRLKLEATSKATAGPTPTNISFQLSDGLVDSDVFTGIVNVIGRDTPVILEAAKRITLDADTPLILTTDHLTIHDPDATPAVDTSAATFTLKAANNITVQRNISTTSTPNFQTINAGTSVTDNTFTQQQLTDGDIWITATGEGASFTVGGTHGTTTLTDATIAIRLSSTIAKDANGDDKEVTLDHTDPDDNDTDASGTLTFTDIHGLANYRLAIAGAQYGVFTITADADPATPATYDWHYTLTPSSTNTIGLRAGNRRETINIIITDDAGNETTYEHKITITVKGEADPAPVFTSMPLAEIDENDDLDGLDVYTAEADDANGDDITFSIKQGVVDANGDDDDADLFTIDAEQGEVTFADVNTNLNFSRNPFYFFTVIATDETGLTAEQVVIVSIAEENPPDTPARRENIALDEDAPYTFTAADFGYAELDSGDDGAIGPSTFITITEIPPLARGVLTLDGRVLAAGDNITAAELTGGVFMFEPARTHTTTFEVLFKYRVTEGGRRGSEEDITLTVVADDDGVGLFTSRTPIGIEVGTRPHIFTLADMRITDPDGPAVDTASSAFTLNDVEGGVVQLFDGRGWNELANDGIFTQQQVADGHVRLIATAGMGTIKIEAAHNGNTFAEQTIAFTARARYEVGGAELGGAGGENAPIDLSGDNTPRVITTGIGEQRIKSGGGDDRVDPGLGDDVVDLTARGDDVVIYRYRAVERPVLDRDGNPVTDSDGVARTTATTIAWDGGDSITGFEPGADRILLQEIGGDGTGAFIDGLGRGFVATIRTAYRTADEGNRAMLSSYDVTGVEIHFSEAVVLPGGVLGGSVISVLFDVATPWDAFNTRWFGGDAGTGANAPFNTEFFQFGWNDAGRAALQNILGLGEVDVVEERLPPPPGIGTAGDDIISTVGPFGDVLVFGMEGDDTITLGDATEEVVYRLGDSTSDTDHIDGLDVVNNFTLGTDKISFVYTGTRFALSTGSNLLNSVTTPVLSFDGSFYTGLNITYSGLSRVNHILQINFADPLTEDEMIKAMGLANKEAFDALFFRRAAPTEATNTHGELNSSAYEPLIKLFGGEEFFGITTSLPEIEQAEDPISEIRSVAIGTEAGEAISTAGENGAWVVYGRGGDDTITLGATTTMPGGANSPPQTIDAAEEIVYRLAYDATKDAFDPDDEESGRISSDDRNAQIHDGSDTINNFGLGTDILTFITPAAKGEASLNRGAFIVRTKAETDDFNELTVSIMEGDAGTPLTIAYTAPAGDEAGTLTITTGPDPDDNPDTDDAETTYQDILNAYEADATEAAADIAAGNDASDHYSTIFEFITPLNTRVTTPGDAEEVIEGGVTPPADLAALMGEFADIALVYNNLNGQYEAIIFTILADDPTTTGGGGTGGGADPVALRVNFTAESRLNNSVLMERLELADDTAAVDGLFEGDRPTTSGPVVLSDTGIAAIETLFGADNIQADITLPVELL